MMDEQLGYGVVAGGGLAWLGQMIWTKVFSTEGKANDQLVEQLSQRLASLETRQIKLEADLDDERNRRRLAEDRVHLLEMANVVLRAELARHNINVDPMLLPDYGLRISTTVEVSP